MSTASNVSDNQILDELDQELDLQMTESYEADMWLSRLLGNRGGFCTITKECMPSCN
ncbi:MAG: lichenicidin alpha family lanthipeptide [Corynebacterium sp.]|uniref:lichenicidin alpha family lanthipeptide n=1 Tax=Corynebacterium sp. TaxID=1720 RepID=UPI0026DAA223|nr:lichenicidin alpha family lanthipeptide [Corynebacterium sp.]MDO5098789.1 lichenicidin alpha family lanthipeptide [Corynebacterium sp.]